MKSEINAKVNDISTSISILDNINWNFSQKSIFLANQVKPFNCRRLHWFPATFIPEIPFTLIEVLSLEKAKILDPFGGIGTTFFQALLLNRIPITIENCIISIEFIKNLYNLFDNKLDFNELNHEIKNIIKQFDPSYNYIGDIPKDVNNIELSRWYSVKTYNELSYLIIKERECSDINLKSLMKISISGILKTVSSQNRGWGCIADNMVPKNNQYTDKNVFNYFIKRINVILSELSNHLRLNNYSFKNYYDHYKKNIYYSDIKLFNDVVDESIDLIISSPPYPNMTDYVKSQRLSYYYFGHNLNNDLKSEIGARYKRNNKNNLENYYNDMCITNEILGKKIKKGGYLCYILPLFRKDNLNNSERKKIIDKVLGNLNKNGFSKKKTYQRILPSMRRSHNIKWATLDKEIIQIYRRE